MQTITRTLTLCDGERFMRALHPFLPTYIPAARFVPGGGVTITAPKAVWDLWVN